MKKSVLVVFLLIMTSAALTLQGCVKVNNYGSLEASTPTINVQGEGKVSVKPDEAIVRFGVQSDDVSLQKAYTDNTDNMNLVIGDVKALDIAEEDIKTSSYSITPMYKRDEKGYQIPGKPSSFRVSQTLEVKVRDLSKLGDLVDSVVAAGSNTFGGINFTLSNIDQVQEEAKAKALEDAREEALMLSKSLGVKIGKVIRINTSSIQPYPRAMMANEAMLAKSAAPQIQPGSMEVTARCNVVYEIRQ